jgi:hypothetical protein
MQVKSLYSLDEKWFKLLRPILASSAEDFLGGDEQYRQDQRQKFLAGKIRNPNLDYPNLNKETLLQRKSALEELSININSGESVEWIKRVYLTRIKEKLVEANLLISTIENAMSDFVKQTAILYGAFDKKLFDSCLLGFLNEVNSTKSDKATDLKAILPIDYISKLEEHPLPIPSLEVREVIKSQYQELIDFPANRQELYQAEDIKQAFELSLNYIGADNWSVIIRPGGVISVNHEKRTVFIPQSRKLILKNLQGLVVHEIGTHVLRGINGERSNLQLLSIGLDGYLAAEEGIATLREASIVGGVDLPKWIARHLAIGLALGVDGKKRDFRDIYDFLFRYYLFQKQQGRETKESPDDEAWLTTVRTFRGTDCSTPGICFTKDKVYLEGYTRICETANKDPHHMSSWNIGKYDPTNVEHCKVIAELELIK